MKKIIKVIPLLLSLGLLASCSSNAKNQSNDTEGKKYSGQTLNWASTGAGDWEEPTEPIIKKFEEMTGAKVNAEFYGHSDYLDMLQVKLDASTYEYDVISVDAPLVASYADKGWILPLDKYFSEEEQNLFTESALISGTWNDTFFAPAMNSSSQVLYYNTALLDEAGVKVPESDVENRLTWEQVVEMAEKVQKKLDPDKNKGIAGIGFEQVTRTYQMNAIPNSLGGSNIGEDGMTADGVLNDAAWNTAVTWYKELFDKGIALKGMTPDDTSDFFRADKVVFLIGGTWGDAAAEKQGFENLERVPVPAFKGYEDKVATPTGSWHLGITRTTKNEELAAEFIKFLTIEEGNTMWLEGNKDVPATKSAVEATLNDDSASKTMKIAAYESANTAVPRALTPGYTEYDNIVQGMWEDTKNGAPVEKSLNDMVNKLEKALKK